MPDPTRTASDPSPVRVHTVTLGPFATNCYVVHAPPSKDCWVVDASFEPEELIERVRRLRLTPRMVILTHAHIDHIAGLEEVRSAFAKEKPRVLIHEAESRFLEDPMLNLSGLYGAPFSTGPADGTLRGGETLELGASRWRVLFTPGHSPGGITMVCDAANVALVGDTLFAGSIGRFDFPTSDEAALVRSIREELYALPDETKVYPGHGPATTIGREKRTNPYVRAE